LRKKEREIDTEEEVLLKGESEYEARASALDIRRHMLMMIKSHNKVISFAAQPLYSSQLFQAAIPVGRQGW
jgi:hypothetical protein